MKRHGRILITTLALTFAPVAAQAAPSTITTSISDAFTWSVVHISRPATPAVIIDKARNWFQGNGQASSASMGFYLGQAATPPPSVFGWDTRQDLAAKVRYGIFLINRF